MPKIASFDVPEGNYRAVLSEEIELDQPKNGCAKLIRLKFDILFPESRTFLYRAGKNYCTDPENSDALIGDLHTLLGDELVNLQDENGEFDLKSLVNREVDIRIEHIHNEKYEKPYVHVAELHAAGKFFPVALK